MTDVLDDLATLAATLGLGAVGTVVFAGRLPDQPDVALALLSYPGEPGTKTMTARPLEVPRVQALARGATHAEAVAKITAAYDALDGHKGVTVGGSRFLWIEALQPPFKLDEDGNARPRWVCNFRVARARP